MEYGFYRIYAVILGFLLTSLRKLSLLSDVKMCRNEVCRILALWRAVDREEKSGLKIFGQNQTIPVSNPTINSFELWNSTKLP